MLATIIGEDSLSWDGRRGECSAAFDQIVERDLRVRAAAETPLDPLGYVHQSWEYWI
jgi:hypothetical protein